MEKAVLAARADRIPHRNPVIDVSSFSEDKEGSDQTYASTGKDESAVLVTSGASVTLNNFTIDRTSTDISTGGDNSSFYGTWRRCPCHRRSPDTHRRHDHHRREAVQASSATATAMFRIRQFTITTKQDTSGGIHVADGGTHRFQPYC